MEEEESGVSSEDVSVAEKVRTELMIYSLSCSLFLHLFFVPCFCLLVFMSIQCFVVRGA